MYGICYHVAINGSAPLIPSQMETNQPKESLALKALEMLLSIPKEDFLFQKFTDKESKCCAYGHIKRLSSDNPNDYSLHNCTMTGECLGIADALYMNSRTFLKTLKPKLHLSILEVNNSPVHNDYPQKIAKTRIIKLLKDMVTAGY